MNSKNVIELNGRRYDAATGKVLGGHAPAKKRQPTAASGKTSRPKTVDGVFRSPARPALAAKAVHQRATAVLHHTSSRPPVAAHAAVKPAAPVSSPRRRAHTTARHLPAHQPQTTHTLMRRAVHKPGPSVKRQINVQTALQTKVSATLVKKFSVGVVEPNRIIRAKNIHRSRLISRFGREAHRVAPSVAHIPVKTPPADSEPPLAPAPHTTNKPLDIFEQAVANASHFVDIKNHRAGLKKRARRHAAGMAAGIIALVVIAGFAAYQNTPGLQLKLAGFRAGVATAHTPDFKAAGFAYRGVHASFGKLVIGLSNAGKQYQLTQQNTNWSNSDMIQGIGSVDASGTPDYNTLQVGATSVYRFGNNSATWIKNGNWYQLSGEALTNNQVASLVKNS